MASFSEIHEKLCNFSAEIYELQTEKLNQLKALLDEFKEPDTDDAQWGFSGIENYELSDIVDETARMLGHRAWLTARNNTFDYQFWIPSSWEC